MSITVAFHTGRRDPMFPSFFASLARQKGIKRVTQIIIVDFYAQVMERDGWTQEDVIRRLLGIQACVRGTHLEKALEIYPPKPTVWQGPHRITKENWWAMSNARNTSIALCRNKWIVLLDDRCVLQPNYLMSVKRAISKPCIVFGSYQKRHNMVVENGVITEPGIVTGVDNREALADGKVVDANGAWAYGCSLALPLELALKANGYPEKADGMGFEDILFGMVLHNNGFPMRYDPNMREK